MRENEQEKKKEEDCDLKLNRDERHRRALPLCDGAMGVSIVRSECIYLGTRHCFTGPPAAAADDKLNRIRESIFLTEWVIVMKRKEEEAL